MSESDARFEDALAQWIAAHAGDRPGVRMIEIEGHRCVVKRRHETLWTRSTFVLRYLRSSISAMTCLLTLHEFPSVRVLLRNGLDDEAGRLRELRAAGYDGPLISEVSLGDAALEETAQAIRKIIAM